MIMESHVTGEVRFDQTYHIPYHDINGLNIIPKIIEDEEVFDSLAQVQVAVQASDSQLMLAVVSVPGAEIPLKQ